MLEMFQVLTGHYNSRLKTIVDYCSVNKLDLKRNKLMRIKIHLRVTEKQFIITCYNLAVSVILLSIK